MSFTRIVEEAYKRKQERIKRLNNLIPPPPLSLGKDIEMMTPAEREEAQLFLVTKWLVKRG